MNASFINSKTLNILFLFFPVVFLMGNAVLNIYILLIGITGIIVFRKKIFSFKNERLAVVILIFFILIFFSTLMDISKDPRNDHFFKSISYFRYFFLFLIIKKFQKQQKELSKRSFLSKGSFTNQNPPISEINFTFRKAFWSFFCEKLFESKGYTNQIWLAKENLSGYS